MVDRLNMKLNVLNFSSSEICTSTQKHKMYKLRGEEWDERCNISCRYITAKKADFVYLVNEGLSKTKTVVFSLTASFFLQMSGKVSLLSLRFRDGCVGVNCKSVVI